MARGWEYTGEKGTFLMISLLCIINQPLIWFCCSISRKMFSSCCCPSEFTSRSKCQDLSLVSCWKFTLISGSEGKCFAILTNFLEFPEGCRIPTELEVTSFMLSTWKSQKAPMPAQVAMWLSWQTFGMRLSQVLSSALSWPLWVPVCWNAG